MKTLLLFLALSLTAFSQTTGIEVDEGTANESVTTVKRVNSVSIVLEKGQDGVIVFRKERLKIVNGAVIRGHDAGSITRNVETVKNETVQHGGQPVTFQTVMALLKKFHDKWEAEPVAP
jgi:hypothetical protein